MLKIVPFILTLVTAMTAGQARQETAAELPAVEPAVTQEAHRSSATGQADGEGLYIIVTDDEKQTPDREEKAQSEKHSGGAADTAKRAPDEDEKPTVSADELLGIKLNALDDKYEKMFAIKSRLDAITGESDKLWQEYYALRESYEREYRRIVYEWSGVPLPRRGR